MAEYLSDEWFEEMESAARAHAPLEPAERAVSLRESIAGSPFGDVTYVMTIDRGKLSVTRDPDVVADVTFSQDYATAAALHRGEITTHDAFFAGKVRVAGHLNTLLENADLLHGVSEAFANVREATTYAAAT